MASRRRVLKTVGAAVGTVAVAGCTGENDPKENQYQTRIQHLDGATGIVTAVTPLVHIVQYDGKGNDRIVDIDMRVTARSDIDRITELHGHRFVGS